MDLNFEFKNEGILHVHVFCSGIEYDLVYIDNSYTYILACVILKQLATSILNIFLLLHIAGHVMRVMVGDAWEQKIVEDN